MALYTVTINNRDYRVNITGDHCTVDGQEVDSRMTALNQSGLHLLRNGIRALEVFLSSHEMDTCQVILAGGRQIVTHITSPFKKQARSQDDSAASNLAAASNLCAPMHGVVVDVPVHEGDLVEKGQTLVILESMKMQMQLRSPRQGRVAKVTAKGGSQVEKGALLVLFE